MKLCSIKCETKSHNLPLATYISGKIIFHALIYAVSFYWVASCVISIKSTEDVWESHLTSENTNHSFICLVEKRSMSPPFPSYKWVIFVKLQSSTLVSVFTYPIGFTAREIPGPGLSGRPGTYLTRGWIRWWTEGKCSRSSASAFRHCWQWAHPVCWRRTVWVDWPLGIPREGCFRLHCTCCTQDKGKENSGR